MSAFKSQNLQLLFQNSTAPLDLNLPALTHLLPLENDISNIEKWP